MAKRKAGSAARKAATRTTPRRGAKKATPAKTKTTARLKTAGSARKKAAGRRGSTRGGAPAAKAKTTATTTKKTAASTAKKRSSGRTAAKAPRKAQVRKKAAPASRARTRDLETPVPTPPSSLNMNRRGSAVRTGRAEIAEERADHATMTPAITGGDVDASVEDAYFTGDEAPGGDNPTPDQDIVDDIGRALGVEYQDNEELRGSDKVAARDKHRWELDPASAEDYRDRK